ncbi:hypothetical protein ISS39_04675 [Candidatus Bathyarchaeota archaeon]|nr:hypothetical protein [Candidatus Bathyarchaeota archaeon]
MKSTLTFYGGVNEIGGNKILLEDQDTRIFLDFGMSFGQSGKYFSESHQQRKCNCIEDFLFTGLLPELEGAYRTDYLEYLDRPIEERGVDAVLLSATRNVLMQTARLQGHKDLSEFDPENDDPESHGRWLRLSAEVLREAGHRAVLDEDRINIYIAST